MNPKKNIILPTSLQTLLNKKFKGFTLIELLLVIGIIAVLAAIVIIAINPTRNIRASYDAERNSEARVYNRAVLQALIDGEDMSMIPSGQDNAEFICKYGESTDCINLDLLYDNNYIGGKTDEQLPVDPAISSSEVHTGYKIFKEVSGIFTIITPYQGSQSVIGGGGGGGGGGSSSSSSSVATAPPVWGSVSSQFNNSSTTSITIAKPASTEESDLLIAVVMHRNITTTLSAPGGWTSLGSVAQPVNSPPGKSEVFYKVASGSEPTDYTFTSSASHDMGVVILRYDDIDTSNPIHMSNGEAKPQYTDERVSSITTTIENTKVLYIYITDIIDSDGVYNVVPSGTTQRFWSEKPTSEFGLMIVDKDQISAGATGIAQFSGYTYRSNGFTIAIKP